MKTASQAQASYIVIHGAFARPSGELMEVAALPAGTRPAKAFHSPVRCEVPDTPADPAADDGSAAEANRNSPLPAEVFAEMDRALALERSTVVMWGPTAYRLHQYAREKGLSAPFFQTQVVDLQAAVVLSFDFKTSQCKSPRAVLELLGLGAAVSSWSSGPLPAARAMSVILGELLAKGWTPESTPAAVTAGSDVGEVAELMRIDRWERIRERQSNLGIERRPLPAVIPAFIVLDSEHASIRREHFSRLIEVALVVAHRKADHYELGETFSSLIHLQQVEHTWAKSWEMTGINPKEVQAAPPLPQVMADMAEAAPWDTGVLVTWGPDDASIITQNCVRAGIPSPITDLPLIDLQRAFVQFYNLGSQQVGLQNAASYLAIDTSTVGLHRALADTVVTWQVLDRMLADGWTPHWRAWHRLSLPATTAR